MPMHDKVEAAKKVDALLKQLLAHGGFRFKYRITVDPPVPEGLGDFEGPEIRVELAGPDSALLLERNAELLRAFEHVALKMLRLESEEHEKISFDCQNYKAIRLEELRMAATVAAEKVRKTGMRYEFGPMSARERRIVHLALRGQQDLVTQSEGEGARRYVVVHLKSAQGAPRPAQPR